MDIEYKLDLIGRALIKLCSDAYRNSREEYWSDDELGDLERELIKAFPQLEAHETPSMGNDIDEWEGD